MGPTELLEMALNVVFVTGVLGVIGLFWEFVTNWMKG